MAPIVCIDGTLTNSDERSDLALVAAANSGDGSAFEALYGRHRDFVVNLAFRFCADRELALDVLQETFFYLLKKFPGFELRCQMRSFLYPVVKHLALSARAKSSRLESGDDLFATLEAPGAEQAADEDLCAAVAKLPVQQRETIVLRFLEGMNLAEIADALEVPVGTVKSRLHHALEALRRNPALHSYFD